MIRTLDDVRCSVCVALCVISSIAVGCGPFATDDDGGDNGGMTSEDTGTMDEDGEDNGGSGDCSDREILGPAQASGGSTVPEGCYLVEQELEVESGTLTLEPGVDVQFQEGTGIDIGSDATLVAEGTSDERIILHGVEQERGFWKGLQYSNESQDNRLVHVELSHAGSSSWNSNIPKGGVNVYRSASLTVENSSFVDNDGPAIRARQEGSRLSVSNSRFASNKMPLRLTPRTAGQIADDNEYENNDDSFISLNEEGTADNVIAAETTWAAQPIPYRFTQFTDVNAKWTIEAGATLEFEQNVGLTVDGDGRLNADAGDGDQIRFTGVEDVQGFWFGIEFENSKSPDNVFNNVVIEYGGSKECTDGGGTDLDFANICLARGDEARIEVRNSTIRGAGKYGIFMDDRSDHEVAACENVTFENNGVGPTLNDDIDGDDGDGPIQACQQ